MIHYLGQIRCCFSQGVAHVHHTLLFVILQLGCFAEPVVHFGHALLLSLQLSKTLSCANLLSLWLCDVVSLRPCFLTI